ncbi:MAG: tRNA uridine(34) 5-carboxymethylaminomethyl modification radical SAM/GNAT enzyme Elp3 [Candidatus Thermoplasmatota archaeon]|nr:tRNA uridine(34) 5-carboxymethylaminomethyl modification radical SAM/GNAT enzyme Elp3 [Candidatus Thermoplasmatota archaeon]
MDFYTEIEREIKSGKIKTKSQLESVKFRIAKDLRMEWIPGDTEILNSSTYSEDEKELLRIKKTRTVSGVAVVAAMTSPESCPHGKCIYCPGGVENNSPQAYTGFEPAALRGRNHAYNPYEIVFNRLKQLETIGHDTSKVDLIIMGGTFTARTKDYQTDYIKGCLDGMNGFVSQDLESSIAENERSTRRCIGLTVETKPDWFMQKEIDLALSYGTTKVELGVQNLKESVLRMNNRGHGIREIAKSTWLSKDAALKVVYHLMPGMYGSSIEDDKKSFERMISCEAYKPDMLKIYPTLVVKGTSLYRLWKNGKYIPMDTEEAVDLIAYYLSIIPPWIRIQRMQRDIPVQFIEAGVKRSDIRNLIEERLSQMGKKSEEIRQREVGHMKSDSGELSLKRIDYKASMGREIFLSYETPDGKIAGFIRLRKPSSAVIRKECIGAGLIREIKVFGEVVPLGSSPGMAWQHKGLGRMLMSEAEAITKDEFSMDRIIVISGIGVREYFRKLGYSNVGPYMGRRM